MIILLRKEGEPLDIEAYKEELGIYLVDRVIPMIPSTIKRYLFFKAGEKD